MHSSQGAWTTFRELFVTEKRPSLTWTDVITPEKSPPGETPVDSQYSSSNQLSSLPESLDTSVQSNTFACGRLPETPCCPYFLRAFLNTPITCLCTKIRLWLICLVVIVTLVLIIVGAILGVVDVSNGLDGNSSSASLEFTSLGTTDPNNIHPTPIHPGIL